MTEFSAEKWNKINEQTQEWYQEFTKSAAYQSLTSEWQQIDQKVIMAFTEFQYKNFTREAKKWTAASLEETIVDQFPSDLILESEKFAGIQPILTAYFEFLEATNKIKNAPTLVKRLEKVAPEMVKREANPVNWSAVKKTGMEINVVQAEVKPNVKKATLPKPSSVQQKIPAGKRQPIHREKVGRNELCPCGSGKKYKKCCGA
nr:SEC-C metal-binding domain-containing protein [Carnobacterium gallinarum]